MSAGEDRERAVAMAWRCLADSCLERDCEHEARAIAELERLGELIPRQVDPA